MAERPIYYTSSRWTSNEFYDLFISLIVGGVHQSGAASCYRTTTGLYTTGGRRAYVLLTIRTAKQTVSYGALLAIRRAGGAMSDPSAACPLTDFARHSAIFRRACPLPRTDCVQID